jgi:hypothetical protein
LSNSGLEERASAVELGWRCEAAEIVGVIFDRSLKVVKGGTVIKIFKIAISNHPSYTLYAA